MPRRQRCLAAGALRSVRSAAGSTTCVLAGIDPVQTAGLAAKFKVVVPARDNASTSR